MREIKFRAWCISERKMYHEVQRAYDYTLIHYADGFGGELAPAACFQELISNVDFIVMQYTGLTDKNEVEVYEGDIIESEEYPMTSEGLLNYRGLIGIDAEGVYWDIKRVSERVAGRACGGDLLELQSFTVVGNIHENPELLEISK